MPSPSLTPCSLRWDRSCSPISNSRSFNPDTALRLGTRLRTGYPVELVADALAQHELRLKARSKFDRAMDMFFTRSGLEQASAEVVACHRSGRYARASRVADPRCGIGGQLHRPGPRPPVLAATAPP